MHGRGEDAPCSRWTQLELTEDERAFRDEMREFFTTKVSEETRETVAAGRELTKDQLVESMRTLNAAGLAVPRWPVEWGGQDWTEIQFHLWREEMERACVPTPLAFNAGMIGPVIAQFGTEEQKKEFLPKTANIDIFWSQGFSEPDAGSDLAGLRTTAVKDGDDWVVNGQKTWTTLGPVRRLDLHAGPHRPRRQEAGRHLDAAHRHGDARVSRSGRSS